MDSSLLTDVPWFITYAAEPFELLKVIHPHLNATTLPPPANPIRLGSLQRRATCDSSSNSNNSNNNNNNSNNSNNTDKKSSNTGVLVGAVVGSVVGTLAIAIICFVIYKKRQRKKLAGNTPADANGVGSPFKDESAMATPFVVPGMNHTPPPNAGGYGPGMGGINPEMQQFHNNMAAGYVQPTNPHMSYMPPPSVASSSNPSGYTGMGSDQGQTNFYNYAPPPAQSPQPTINSSITGTASTGISYYGSTPAPPFMNPHSTPSPPPPSGTPSNAGQWAPWAVPSTADYSGTGMFPTAAEEKAHYSGREWPDEKAQYRSNTISSNKVGEGSKAGGSSTNVAAAAAAAENTGPAMADPRDGARSPGVGITSGAGAREGALSPSPPAYSAQ